VTAHGKHGRRGLIINLVGLLVSLNAVAFVSAEESRAKKFEVGGLLFGDSYHIVSHHTEEGEGATGLVLRRGYLTFDADFSEQLFGRLRFEVNQAGEFETYTFEVDFKDLYLGWNVGRHQLKFGLSPTPTFDLIESIWGFRYLARTPLDLQGVASRDTGVFSKGPLNASGSWSYRAMVGAGLEFGNESGDGRKWMGAVAWNPSPKWTIDLYMDYEKLRGPTDRTTLQVFAGYTTDDLRWGVQYSHQDRQEDEPLELASAFLIAQLDAKTSFVGPVDRLIQPSPSADNIAYIPFAPDAPATFLLTGVEFEISRHFYVVPNTIVISYDKNDEGVRPRTDFHLRVTFFLDLE
jgi:hypothetical protein